MTKILAVVTTKRETLIGSDALAFFAESEEAQQQLAFNLEKILDASAHDLKNGSIILVDHRA